MDEAAGLLFNYWELWLVGIPSIHIKVFKVPSLCGFGRGALSDKLYGALFLRVALFAAAKEQESSSI